jgi:hypothetical protein
MSYGDRTNYPTTRYDLGASAEPPTRRSAPAPVHAVALLLYLGGLLVFALAVVAAGGGSLLGNQLDQVPATGGGLPLAAIYGFVGLFMLAIGRKVQRGRGWARGLVIILSVVSVVVTLYTGFSSPDGTSNVLLGLVFPVLYLILLFTPSARSWFRDRTY